MAAPIVPKSNDMFAEPSNSTPWFPIVIVLLVCNLVAVEALPLNEPVTFVTMALLTKLISLLVYPLGIEPTVLGAIKVQPTPSSNLTFIVAAVAAAW